MSPYDFGLRQARSGVERYEVLLRTHQAAVSAGVNVDYDGIKSISIEIPSDFVQIPLTRVNDFKGCIISIKNTSKKVWLFGTEQKSTQIFVQKSLIDAGNFRKVPELIKGSFLLLIEDEKPWVSSRQGYSYGHIRKDVLLVEDGVAKNSVVMPYNNAASSPKCSYIPVGAGPLEVKNLTINRESSCSFVTYLFYVSGYNDVRFTNVTINTPENTLYDDSAIRIYNSTNVLLTDVRINGTYSQRNHSGYGISLGNVWNFKALRLYANGNSGVFGTSNVNTAYLEDSDINRFDIHCYGRDVTFRRVRFSNLHNQYSSVFGDIRHIECTFTDFAPINIETSYNSYVGFNAWFEDCTFNVVGSKNYLIGAGYVNDKKNSRPELSKKSWPNLYVNNLTVNLDAGQNCLVLIKNVADGSSRPKLDYISEIMINGLTVNTKGTPLERILISNIELRTIKDVKCEIQNVLINEQLLRTRTSAQTRITKPVTVQGNLPLQGNTIHLINASGLKQE